MSLHACRICLTFKPINYYLHYNDAKKCSEWAKEAEDEGSPLCSLYARHSIMSVVFASEALINRVINQFSIISDLLKDIEKLSIQEKWHIAPLLCRDKDWEPETFDKGMEPFQSFSELIKIRNWLVHPKVEIFVDAESTPNSTVGTIGSEASYPWLETLKSSVWPQTQIPKNPFELSFSHSVKAITVFDEMVSMLRKLLKGKMYNGWIDEISIRDKNGLHHYTAPVFTLWGGYRPKN
jgi:hypothetical protein